MVGPGLIGCALGVLAGDGLTKSARVPVAIGLAALGVAALTPQAAAVIWKKFTGPTTHRGSARRLRSIRGQGAVEPGDFGMSGDEFDENSLGV